MYIWLFIVNSNCIKCFSALSQCILKIHSWLHSFIICLLPLICSSILSTKTKVNLLLLQFLNFLIFHLQLHFLSASITNSRPTPSIGKPLDCQIYRVSSPMFWRNCASTYYLHWQQIYSAFASFDQSIDVGGQRLFQDLSTEIISKVVAVSSGKVIA